MHPHTVTVQHHDLRVWRTGGDLPPILLVHGFTDGAMAWRSLIPRLTPHYEVIAYDSRGHGDSARVTAPYTIDDLAEECYGLMQALGLNQIPVIGHSMGAAIAFLVAHDYPDAVAKVVLEDPPFTHQPLLGQRDLQAWQAGVQTLQAMPREAVVAYFRANEYAQWGEDDLQSRVDVRLKLDPAVFEQMDWSRARRWQTLATTMRVDGLLLTGDVALGGIITPDVATELCQSWAQLGHVHVPQAGHHVRCVAPDAYWQAIHAFLGL